MRTTLVIDDDVLAAAKGLALRQHKSIGEVISGLARQGLRPSTAVTPAIRNGVPLLPLRSDATPVTPELVAQMNDELP
ncbi:MAG: CopG family transcriptional regulator [Steroidobacteraceae bacterium]